MATAKITSKGQITIPKELRDAFDLEPGDTVHFTVREGGEIVMETEERDIRELRGDVEADVEGVSVQEMKDIVRQRGSDQ